MMPTGKRCSRCKEWKARDAFSQSRSKADGLGSYCRECMQLYRREHAERIKERCQAWIERDPDHARELARAREKKYRETSPEKAAAKRERYAKKHPEREQARWRRYRTENPDKIKAKKHRREARKRGNGGAFTDAQWVALKERYGHRCLSCRKTETEIVAEQGYGLTPDHIVSLASGGSGAIENIQPLCKLCNSRKGSKTVDYRTRASCN